MAKRKTTEQFISDAVARHGRRYDYSNTVYLGWDKQVEIICKEHGSFWQIASQHTLGSNCPVCVSENRRVNIERLQSLDIKPLTLLTKVVSSVSDKVTLICPTHGEFTISTMRLILGSRCKKCSGKMVDRETFLERAKQKFNNRFVYDMSNYVNISSTIIISCPVHGSVHIVAHRHLTISKGCPLCSSSKSKPMLSLDEFISRSKEHFGDMFEYNSSVYNGSDQPIIVRCRKHGDIQIRKAGLHSTGKVGCRKCVSEKGLEKKHLQFVNTASSVHEGRYDYSKTVFENAKKKVIITCPTHGDFLQTPQQHLSLNGCPKCAGRMTQAEFIERANTVHDGVYAYSKTEYHNVNKHITITCKEHGDYVIIAALHLSGSGCPNCIRARSSKKEKEWIASLGSEILVEHRLTLTDGTIVFPDGFDPVSNTIYEFHGDYWHGNPVVYDQDKVSQKHQMTFGELYQRTLDRTQKLRDHGYTVVEMWEHDWDKMTQLRIKNDTKKL